MNIKISLLSVAFLAMSVYAGAQSARNPLNQEPMRISIKKNPSSWKLTDEIFYSTDGIPFDKRIVNYDVNGQKISETNQRWSVKNKSWQNTTKCDFINDDNKYIEISSDANMSGWQSKTKTETVYNPDGKPDYSLSYSWNKEIDDWSVTPSLKCEWVYDNNGRAVEYTKQRWNKEVYEWNAPHARITYLYDPAGEVSEELYSSWSAKNNSWIDEGKYIYSAGDKNQKNAKSYIYVSGKWTPDGEVIYTYDEDGKVSRGDYFGRESLSAYSLYTYSENAKCEVIPETKVINIYPNPVVSSFELTVPESFAGKSASIFDAWGKQVRSVIINNEKMQVNVTGLTGGIYVLRIDEYAEKLVIK